MQSETPQSKITEEKDREEMINSLLEIVKSLSTENISDLLKYAQSLRKDSEDKKSAITTDTESVETEGEAKNRKRDRPSSPDSSPSLPVRFSANSLQISSRRQAYYRQSARK